MSAKLGKLDRLDIRILDALQQDADRSLGELSEAVGLSANACWKRIKRLEAAGIIERRVALLNRDALGLGVTALVSVSTSQHDESWLERFAEGVKLIPEVVEFYRMSGQIDYMLKIVCTDISDYDRIYKKLIKAAPLSDVSAAFAMEQIKYTTRVPLDGL
jgi:Lrp/AsnC family transcriptional regulator